MISRRPPNPVYILRGHTSPISCLSVNNDCTVVFSGTQSGDIALWNLKERRQIRCRKQFHVGSVLETGFLSSTSLFSISHGKDGKIQLFDITNGLDSISSTYSCGSLTFLKASKARDSDHVLFVPMENDSIGLLDIRDKTIHPFIPQQKTNGMVMSCQGSLSDICVVAYESGHLCLFDSSTHSIIEEYSLFHSPILSCASSTDLQSFVCGSPQNEIAFCSRQSSNIQIMKSPNDGNLALALRNDNKLLAVGGKDGILRIYNFKTHQPLAYLSNHHLSIQSVIFGNDNSLYSGGNDANIMVWDIYQHSNQ